MKDICKACKSSLPVDKGVVKKAIGLRTILATTGKELAGKPERKAKLKGIRRRQEYEVLKGAVGLEGMVSKPTDTDSPYVACQNKEHQKDEGADKPVVHKYYFSCPHFEEKA